MENILNKKLHTLPSKDSRKAGNKNKKISYNTSILTLLKSNTLSIFPYQSKYLKIPLFSKNYQILEDKIWFSDDQNIRWFTFLPFETPSLLFLPKMGIVLFHSSCFSIINSF